MTLVRPFELIYRHEEIPGIIWKMIPGIVIKILITSFAYQVHKFKVILGDQG